MTEQTVAVSLMRMALALLDRAGMTVAACHLDQALRVASNQPNERVQTPPPPA